MKIGFWLNDKNIVGTNLSKPHLGNPGIGGTEYQIVLHAYYIHLLLKCEVAILHFETDLLLPEGIESITMNASNEMIQAYNMAKLDLLVITSNSNGIADNNWYDKAENAGIKCVIWCHCYIDKNRLNAYAKYSFIKKIVFVGKQQHDTYYDSSIMEKSTWIYVIQPRAVVKRDGKCKNNVTYCGAIVQQKGFHILAKAWKRVVAEVPDAELYVIGSGALYNRNSQLGRWGIASEAYENTFMNYLLDDNNEIMKSVHFLGKINEKEKVEIYRKTKVGCVNPTGKTECCCASALEMEAMGIPVVSAAKYGQFDVILDKETGILINKEKQLADAIIGLLKHRQTNDKLGINACNFVSTTFCPEIIVSEWEKVFEDVQKGSNTMKKRPNNHFGDRMKFAKIVIHDLRKIPLFRNIPSIFDLRR